MQRIESSNHQPDFIDLCPKITVAPYFADLSVRLQAETQSRPARVEQLGALVEKLFPGEAVADLRAEIKRTFNVPQMGDYHKEGVFMDTHFALIIEAINKVRSGEIDPRVPSDVAEVLQTITRHHLQDLTRYTFLHDLDKPSCVTIAYADGRAKEITMEELFSLVPESCAGNCQAAYDALLSQGLEKISYFQQANKRVHGRIAAERLRNQSEVLNLSENIISAIDLHEVAYQFTTGRADNFRKQFGSLNADQQAWVLVASYIDLSGSLKKDGKPDISPFLNLIQAMKNSEIVSYLESQKGDPAHAAVIDAGKYQKYITGLLKRDDLIAPSCEEALADALKACAISRYQRSALTKNLNKLVGNGLDQKTCDDILSCLVGDGDVVTIDQERIKPIKTRLGQLNASVAKALEEGLLR